MRKTNRFMALFIVIAMLATMMSFAATVSAEESAVSSVIEVTDADVDVASKLQTLGVITNEFDLSKYVTRGEMASIAMTYAKIPASTSAQAFKDVAPEHPFYHQIGALYNMGVVTGDDNGNFNPDAYVTYDEALVYIINALGHKPFAVREGGYPTGYHRIAIKHGMLANLSMNKGTDKATLADVYRMLDEGLSAATVIETYYGNGEATYTLSTTETFLSAIHNINVYRGIVTAVEGTSIDAVDPKLGTDQIRINGKLYNLGGYPEFNLVGYSVDYYVSTEDDETVLYLEETARANSKITIDAEDILDKTTDTRVYYTDAEDKEYHIDISRSLAVLYNGQYDEMYGTLELAIPAKGYIEALDNDRDGVYDVVSIYTYTNIVVDGISSDYKKIRDRITGRTFDLSDDGQIVKVYYRNSRLLTPDSIQLGDVLSISESKLEPKVKTVNISREMVMGEIESMGADGYLINGTWYKAADSTYAAENLKLGKNSTFYLDMNNEIVYYDVDFSERKGDTAVMSGIDYDLSTLGSTIKVRIFTSAGDMVYFPLKENVKIDGVKYDLGELEDTSKVKGAKSALTALATDTTGGKYKVTKAYVLNYIAVDGVITELDLGNMSGAGNLKKQTGDTCTYMLVRTGNILRYSDEDGLIIRQRLNPKSKLVFCVPSEGNLEDFDAYELKSVVINEVYGTEPNIQDYYAENIDIYTYNETTYPMADVVMLTGAQTSVTEATKEDTLDIVVDATATVTEDGEKTVKLYMYNNTLVLKPQLMYTENGTATEVNAIDLYNGGKFFEGLVVQFAKNKDGEIYALRAVVKYDYASAEATTKSLITMYATGQKFIEASEDGPTNGTNLYMGKIEGADFDSRQAYFKTPDQTNTQLHYLYFTGDEVVIYDSDAGEFIKGTMTDIMPGDIFVSSIRVFFCPETFIIFR